MKIFPKTVVLLLFLFCSYLTAGEVENWRKMESLLGTIVQQNFAGTYDQEGLHAMEKNIVQLATLVTPGVPGEKILARYISDFNHYLQVVSQSRVVKAKLVEGQFTTKGFDVPDIYVVVEVKGGKVWSSSIVKNKQNPIWKEEFSFSWAPGDSIVIYAKDRDFKYDDVVFSKNLSGFFSIYELDGEISSGKNSLLFQCDYPKTPQVDALVECREVLRHAISSYQNAPVEPSTKAVLTIGGLHLVDENGQKKVTFFATDRASAQMEWRIDEIGRGDTTQVEVAILGPDKSSRTIAQMSLPACKGRVNMAVAVPLVGLAKGQYHLALRLALDGQNSSQAATFVIEEAEVESKTPVENYPQNEPESATEETFADDYDGELEEENETETIPATTETPANEDSSKADFEITKLELVTRGRKETRVFNSEKDRKYMAVWVHHQIYDIGPGGNMTFELSGKGPGYAKVETRKITAKKIKVGKFGHSNSFYRIPINITNPEEGDYDLEVKMIFYDKVAVARTTFEIDNEEQKISAGTADFEITKLELVTKGRREARIFNYEKDRKYMAVWVHHQIYDIGPGGNMTFELSGKGPGYAKVETRKITAKKIKVGKFGHSNSFYRIPIDITNPEEGDYDLEVKMIFYDKTVVSKTTFAVEVE